MNEELLNLPTKINFLPQNYCQVNKNTYFCIKKDKFRMR